ncbi:acyl carrier protein [Streptomyces sp. 4.24]|uniref:acyl carrier protein n=1 Tax=Streptomyces tritrimontium TaxID=3406573 RepID=UPI003BB506BE
MSVEDQTLAIAHPDEAPDAVVAEVTHLLADVLRVNPELIDPGQTFVSLGVGSVATVQFVSVVNTRYGTALKATSLFGQPTPLAFAALVAREAGIREQGVASAEPAPAEPAPADQAAADGQRLGDGRPFAEDQAAAEELGALLDAVRADRLSVDEALTRLPHQA